ncbi:putative tetratricopeptide repeat protein [Blattamonas nauphoetae]|uniref:Tetratricopeptide repeat protein n=1 Tax=Blattamonas nauphoetae TaxID=2049346 RepID=A0ABQ9X649_9EUKA|nr:putative tetratricopeptide repeat protein [Blattamonas nauphoetae]
MSSRFVATIGEEWKESPLKNPPMSVVLKDHLGQGSTGESYKTIQVDANDYLRRGDYDRAIRAARRCEKKILASLGPQSTELIYIMILLCEAYTEKKLYAEAQRLNVFDLLIERLFTEYIERAGDLLDACPGITDAHIYRVYYYRDLGNLYRINGKLDEALACFQRVAETRRIYQGETHPDTALALVDLGITYKMRGQFEKALQFFIFALNVQEEFFGSNSLAVGSNLLHQGSVYLSMGRWSEAQQTIKQGRTILVVNGLGEHTDVAIAECNLGIIAGKLEKYDEAMSHFDRARTLREKLFGMTHPDTAQVYLHMARLLNMKKNYSEAERYASLALSILEDSIVSAAPSFFNSGSGKPAVTASGKPINSALKAAFAVAMKNKQMSLVHGGNTFPTAMSGPTINLGTTPTGVQTPFASQSDGDDSLSGTETVTSTPKSRRRRKKTTKKDDLISRSELTPALFVGLAGCEATLGQINVSNKNFDGARSHFKKAKELYEVLPGHENDVKEIDTCIANAFLTEGASGDALQIFQHLLDRMESEDEHARKKGKNKANADNEPVNPNLAAVLNGMGNAFRQQGRFDEALQRYTRALQIYSQSAGMFDESTALVHMNIGHTYYSAECMDKAMKHFIRARAIRTKLYGTVHPLTCTTFKALAAVHFACNQFDEAIEMYSRAADGLEVLWGDQHPEILEIRKTIAEVIKDRAHHLQNL